MKKKSIFAVLLIMMLASALFMTACGKTGGSGSSGGSSEPETLEQYAINNPSVQQSIDEATADSDVEVEIKGNDVIYSFELSKMEGYTEDVATDPQVVESLQTALDNAGPTFGGIAKTLETATGISGIHVIVNYTYDGELLATQTFDSSQANNASSSADNIDWSDSSNYEGQNVSVIGPAISVHNGSPCIINIGNDYPNQNRFQIIINENDIGKFNDLEDYVGHTVLVKGVVEMYSYESYSVPQIVVSDPDDIIVSD